jgi:hypothetical protein
MLYSKLQKNITMTFTEYSSIANAQNPRMIEKFASARKFYDVNTVWVTEKRHGANFSMITDGKSISFASGTQVLDPEENFYRVFEHTEFLDSLKTSILLLHEIVKKDFGNDCEIQLFGELFDEVE